MLKPSLLLAASLCLCVPCFSAPACVTHIVVVQYDQSGAEIGGLDSVDKQWLDKEIGKKHHGLCTDAKVSNSSQYAFVLREVGTSSANGTQTVHSSTTSGVYPANCPSCQPVAVIDTPTTEEVPYSQMSRTYAIAVVYLHDGTTKELATFSRTQVRTSGGKPGIVGIIANSKGQHPVEDLLKDALKYMDGHVKSS